MLQVDTVVVLELEHIPYLFGDSAIRFCGPVILRRQVALVLLLSETL